MRPREAPADRAHWRPAIAPPTNDEPRINDRIRAREVRLIDAGGNQVGIKPLPEAMSIARAADLDLVEVAAAASPPVCRIMDYGKFKYEEAQKQKVARKKARHSEVKEMKYRPKISGGDFETKTRKVEKFLSEGHKVKITIMFRGREVFHPQLGMEILDRVAETVTEVGQVEQQARLDGRNMTMVLAPDRRAARSRSDKAKAREEADGEGDGSTAGVATADAGAGDRPAMPAAPPPPAPAPVAAQRPAANE